MHPRISLSQICFQNLGLEQFAGIARELGARQVSLLSHSLLEEGGFARAQTVLGHSGARTETITHIFQPGRPISPDPATWAAPRDTLARVIDMASALGARSIYMLSGGHGGLVWEDAAAAFAAAIAPCLPAARAADIAIMIEPASHIMADIHIAHSLADTLELAKIAGIGVCLDIFSCWGESGLREKIARAMPGCRMIQLSDHVPGDRSLPARAVPGDGAVPLERIIGWALEAGYEGAFDLELLGPRIDAEGTLAAVRRGNDYVGAILTKLGA